MNLFRMRFHSKTDSYHSIIFVPEELYRKPKNSAKESRSLRFLFFIAYSGKWLPFSVFLQLQFNRITDILMFLSVTEDLITVHSFEQPRIFLNNAQSKSSPKLFRLAFISAFNYHLYQMWRLRWSRFPFIVMSFILFPRDNYYQWRRHDLHFFDRF